MSNPIHNFNYNKTKWTINADCFKYFTFISSKLTNTSSSGTELITEIPMPPTKRTCTSTAVESSSPDCDETLFIYTTSFSIHVHQKSAPTEFALQYLPAYKNLYLRTC